MLIDRIIAVWHWLTEPNSAIQEPGPRSQAKLLLSLMAFLLPLGILGIVFPILVNPDRLSKQTPLLLIIIILTFMLFITYLVSRSQHYRLAIYIALTVGVAAILLIARVDESPGDLHALYYLLILVLASTLFLSIRSAIFFSFVTLAILLATPLFIPEVSLYEVAVGPFNLVLLATVANLFTAYYRNQLERNRQLELTDLLHELSNRAAQLSALQETALDIVSHRDINELLQAIIFRAANLIQVAGGSLFLVNPDGDSLTLTAVHGPGEELEGIQIQRGEGMAGKVLATGQPLIISDYDSWDKRAEDIPKNRISSAIQVPIISTGKVIGVLSCQEEAGVGRTFTEEEIKLLEGLARQSAIALQNAYLFKEEQVARERAERLQAASQALSSSLELQEVFQNILVELRKVVPYDSATVQQIKDTHYLEIIGGDGFPNREEIMGIRFDITSDDFPNQKVIKTKSPVILENAPALYKNFKLKPYSETVIFSWLGVPLLFGNQISGMLALDKQEIGYYTEEHARLASAFAAQAAVAIENARLYEEARQRAFELETLAKISASLRTVKTVDEMLPILLNLTVEATGATYSVLFLVEQETGELVSRLSVPSDFYQTGLRQQPGEGITGHVAATGEIYVSDDIANDPMLALLPGELESFRGTTSSVSVPLQTPERTVGVMHIASDKHNTFSDADVRLITAVSNIAANALNRATVLDTLEEHVKERTRELAEANLRLKELDALKTKFISDMSHELRTPVATLNLYMDLLERGKLENRQKYMAILRQKTDLLVRLTEDILNVSRLNLYEGELSITTVNLNETVAIVIAMHQERAQATDIELIFSPAPNLPPIRAERNQLIQAITNVISNALDYTEAGYVQVSTYLLPESQRACLKVKDTGIGIAPDEMPHIFDRFYRGHRVAQSSIPGTGLGLAIAKEIIDLHKGSIEVDSTPGQGSTFRIEWPLADT